MLTTPNWQPANPINAIIFDCDGTLSTIEGIDQLAIKNNVGAEVAALTEQAMGKTGINPAIYRKRLALINPHLDEVLQIGKQYCEQLTPDVDQVIQVFLRLNKTVFIASAGLKPAVDMLGASLDIPEKNIFAVDIQFDAEGRYVDFDTHSPLTVALGKQEIAQKILQQYKTVAHIGDGMNDFVVRDVVTRFIGYGGTYYRANIEAGCEFYIKTPSLAGLLPLLLTRAESEKLTPTELALYNKGIASLTLT